MKAQLTHKFEDIISLENLLLAWTEFLRGKRKRRDVQEFTSRLMDNIFSLRDDLVARSYEHGGYQSFRVSDPKPRHIHKASVRDRLLHRAVYRKLYPFFDRTFISESYSCRLNKGTHKALKCFHNYFSKVSRNNTKSCWVLKGDIRKFFASIDQEVLQNILKEYIADKNIIWLLSRIIASFDSGLKNKGLPLGNLTSQLLANIYLNKFDQFIKHRLKVKYYIRYADDFVILSDNKEWLEKLIQPISNFLAANLKLELHPNKLFLKTVSSGIDFLGWVHFPDHRVLRTVTKRRMLKRIKVNFNQESLASYLGLIKQGNARKLEAYLLQQNLINSLLLIDIRPEI